MNKVHVLPPELISKIAAGEVVERPASVIKELVENALDAKSTSIEIHLQEAGKTAIRIIDHGTGISREDLEVIFQRHATSKISSVSDLFDIHSLGFRGEALYSIAAISDVTLRSRTASDETGWEIHVRGGERKSLRPFPMAIGTEIEVKELFFNTPARRKFLKSNTSEMNQIVATIIPYTILYPSCRFLLTHEGKTLLDLPSREDQATRIANALNLSESHLLTASHTLSEKNVQFQLVLGDINMVRSRRDMQFIFVNGRPVESKNISYHLNDVYRLILPPGNFPFFAIFIDVPAEHVDVNVHPTKREVRIKDEYALCAVLRSVCERTLMTQGDAKQVEQTSHSPSDISSALSKTNRLQNVWEEESSSLGATQLPTEQYTFPQNKSWDSETTLYERPEQLPTKLNRARYIGPFLNKFLLFEANHSLLVVDQHAAQERITFEHLIQQLEKHQVEIQHLLSPYLIKITPQEMLNWEEVKKQLEDVGFSCTNFDEETIAVHTYPVLLKNPEKAVRDILAGGNVAKCDHETLARRACRASIMAGDPLTAEQAEFQRQQLLACRDPFTCPHGRPTVIEMKEDFLDKQFLRT
ncbi:MAG: DNA mismatch repair endonuclease MutL [Candidatus Omnitrophica bacterium]|nr:DNA mismatch repair endonuclease MutL [Candidatus Omnitrophota bacterium]